MNRAVHGRDSTSFLNFLQGCIIFREFRATSPTRLRLSFLASVILIRNTLFGSPRGCVGLVPVFSIVFRVLSHTATPSPGQLGVLAFRFSVDFFVRPIIITLDLLPLYDGPRVYARLMLSIVFRVLGRRATPAHGQLGVPIFPAGQCSSGDGSRFGSGDASQFGRTVVQGAVTISILITLAFLDGP